jgi:integrase
MSINSRQIKNKRNKEGVSTSRVGTVYDVFIRYKTGNGYKTYGKRGFATKQSALDHEAEMRIKLGNDSYKVEKASDMKLTVKEYLDDWIEIHGKANLRPSTMAGYKNHIKNQIVPYIGNVPLKKLTPEMIDKMFQEIFSEGLSQNTVKYAQRILSVALEAARKYKYIDGNPAREILTKFGKKAKTPNPYTVEQMQQLMKYSIGNEWEMIFVLSGMYGLRRNEILGLRWQNVDLKNMKFKVIEQLPYKIPRGSTIIKEMAPTKAEGRELPITEITMPYFKRQLMLQHKDKEIATVLGEVYYENDIVVSKKNGAPMRDDIVTKGFQRLLKKYGLPYMRFHDMRHSAATNMHQLTGDFYTVGELLGHTLKGIGMSLGISNSLDAVTSDYVNVRIERKLAVLNVYHQALHYTDVVMTRKNKANEQRSDER